MSGYISGGYGDPPNLAEIWDGSPDPIAKIDEQLAADADAEIEKMAAWLDEPEPMNDTDALLANAAVWIADAEADRAQRTTRTAKSAALAESERSDERVQAILRKRLATELAWEARNGR